ncbi:spore germination protein GerPC [Paenibacillus sp. G2S3]|uniref:spore germination protein GerPC n=1 Tax=Paenibacillus sp. G2S3 TaxID=3047872 RepID=UPI0024C0F4B5|nr:spore germination protein GerPC [Paenibacillus sp. G2S3]WHY17028.1 spore germination protein GerPC [Paenibacillus sp. G2S3]
MHPYYVQQVFNALRVQAEKIQLLEKQLQDLQGDIDSIKNNKTASIGPINYHFEQLKIEKLEGTLNIGITPNEGNNLDEAMINGKPIGEQEGGITALSDKIRPEILKYVQEEVPSQFSRLEREQNLSIDENYIQMVTQDLLNQMDGRINEYVSQLPAAEEGRGYTEEESASIVEQIKRDIVMAVERHLEINITGRREPHESDRD